MKITITAEKARSGIYSDNLVFDSWVDLVKAIERFFPVHSVIPARYIRKEVAKAKRIELLAKALVESLKAITP